MITVGLFDLPGDPFTLRPGDDPFDITQADLDPRPGDFAIPADFDLPVSGPDEPPINPFTIDEQGPTPFDRATADDADGW